MVKCNADQLRRLPQALEREKNPKMRQRIQMVLLREGGMTQPEIANATGVSLSTVNRAHMAYDYGGRAARAAKPCGGRIRENMTLGEEKALLDCFAKAAAAGEMLNIHDLKAAYEEAIGHPTSDSTVYNVLNPDDWCKLMLRPFHPDRDIEAQDNYKKGFAEGKKSETDRRKKWSSVADHVCRRSSLWSDEPSRALLSSTERDSGRLCSSFANSFTSTRRLARLTALALS
jgi:transposase